MNFVACALTLLNDRLTQWEIKIVPSDLAEFCTLSLRYQLLEKYENRTFINVL